MCRTPVIEPIICGSELRRVQDFEYTPASAGTFEQTTTLFTHATLSFKTSFTFYKTPSICILVRHSEMSRFSRSHSCCWSALTASLDFKFHERRSGKPIDDPQHHPRSLDYRLSIQNQPQPMPSEVRSNASEQRCRNQSDRTATRLQQSNCLVWLPCLGFTLQ